MARERKIPSFTPDQLEQIEHGKRKVLDSYRDKTPAPAVRPAPAPAPPAARAPAPPLSQPPMGKPTVPSMPLMRGGGGGGGGPAGPVQQINPPMMSSFGPDPNDPLGLGPGFRYSRGGKVKAGSPKITAPCHDSKTIKC